MHDDIQINVNKKEKHDKNNKEIDVSFLPEDEKLIWHSRGWANYLEIYKKSLRKFIITNVVAIIICIAVSIMFILYVSEVIPYLIWFNLIIYGLTIFIAYATAIVASSISPFTFISILKYKKIYSEDALNPYLSFKLLTTKNFIFKAIRNPKTKWSDFQKESFKIEQDRITCSIEHIKLVILQSDHFGNYKLTTYGKFPANSEEHPSRGTRLLKWNLYPNEVKEILPYLLNLENEKKMSLKIYGTSNELLYVFFLILIIIYFIGSLSS